MPCSLRSGRILAKVDHLSMRIGRVMFLGPVLDYGDRLSLLEDLLKQLSRGKSIPKFAFDSLLESQDTKELLRKSPHPWPESEVAFTFPKHTASFEDSHPYPDHSHWAGSSHLSSVSSLSVTTGTSLAFPVQTNHGFTDGYGADITTVVSADSSGNIKISSNSENATCIRRAG